MFTIEFNNDQITPALDRVAVALGDMTPVMGRMAEAWRKSTQNRMERGEQPDGTPFAPRSPVTLERYAAQGFSFGAPLNRSGEMRQQLATESGPDFLRIGSNAIQSAVMQFGASPSGDIPARPFLGISDEDETNMMAELAEWLENAASGGN
jgi:phage virion morphogenesis protein